MIKDDAYRLAAIRRMGSELLSYVREYGITANKIMSDHVVQWTLATPLYNIGEQVHHLSSELKEANPDIPWFKIAGMRHRLVHDYESTNWMIVAQTVLEDIPAFLQDIEHVVLPRSPEE